jgi:putative oxidoreductase
MINRLFSSKGAWDNGLAIVRVVTGSFLIFHGTQMFQTEDMKGYGQWLSDLHVPLPVIMAYTGKATELIGGLCLALGLLTRLATISLTISFTVITFVMGHGKIFSDDQHPFLFILLALVFFFSGPGPWSLDHLLFDRWKDSRE